MECESGAIEIRGLWMYVGLGLLANWENEILYYDENTNFAFEDPRTPGTSYFQSLERRIVMNRRWP